MEIRGRGENHEIPRSPQLHTNRVGQGKSRDFVVIYSAYDFPRFPAVGRLHLVEPFSGVTRFCGEVWIGNMDHALEIRFMVGYATMVVS